MSDPDSALSAGAPKLHDTLDSNLVFERTLRFGDVDGAFAGAARVVRRQLRWNRMGAQPIETAGALASFDPYSGTMTVWSNTK